MKQAKEQEPEPEKEVKDESLFVNKKGKNPNFEDKMSSFMKKSEERQIDIRRNLKNKQGISKRRR